jgi:hypothetical protein
MCEANSLNPCLTLGIRTNNEESIHDLIGDVIAQYAKCRVTGVCNKVQNCVPSCGVIVVTRG